MPVISPIARYRGGVGGEGAVGGGGAVGERVGWVVGVG